MTIDTIENPTETLGFQAEVKQLLKLMIHSLYSKKEIFLRELISNAADAIDKLRFETLTDSACIEKNGDLKIRVTFDKENRTLTISDNGIGMSREEIISHLGIIAKSGTREFLSQLSGDQQKDLHLIGQFGVGFYSVFIVADKVRVLSRRAGLSAEYGVQWESRGEGDYTVSTIQKQNCGTDVILYLKESEDEFLNEWRLQNIIKKYSDHITVPIEMKKIEGLEENKEAQEIFEVVNKATALWTLPKNEITEVEYKDYYKYIAHDFEDPLCWSHHRVEGQLDYISLLYIPSQAPMDLFQRDRHQGIKLYVQRVFILDDTENFLPLYLRFMRGIIDTNVLPLNVSRELLQSNPLVDKLRSALVVRSLSMLENLAEKEPEKYQQFWKAFGKVLKEGPAEDFNHRERVATLCRFASTHNDTADETVSLKDYVSRMKPEQKKIYYVTADTFNTAKSSPHIEIFRQKNIEVLLLHDKIDEWFVGHLTEFEGKPLQSVAKGKLELDDMIDESVDKEKQAEHEKEIEKEFSATTQQMKTVLGDRVKEVRLTHRLTDSPACLVADEHELGSQMQRILKAAGQTITESKPILELNPTHALILNLKNEKSDASFQELAEVLFDQALLSEGGHIADPATFVKRINRLLLEGMAHQT